MAELTELNKAQIQQSWSLVKQNMRKHSMDFFVCFFKRHPQHQKLFRDFADINVNELPSVQKFRGHAVRVFFAISSLVENLDDLDTVVDILQKTARDHVPRGIKLGHYQDLFETVLYFLGQTLPGESFTESCRQSWQILSDVMLAVIRAEVDTDLPDEMKTLVSASWEPVRQNMRKLSMDFFMFFFKRHPEFMALFKDFALVPVDDLPQHSKFRGHAVRVFFAVTSLVDNLDDLDIVTDILRKTVRDHVPRGIGTVHYTGMFESVLAFLENSLGADFDAKTKEAWQRVAKVMLSVITDELEAVQESADQTTKAAS